MHAFDELYRSEFGALMRELKRTLRDNARREEAITDAFVELHRKLERGDEVDDPKALLRTIAKRRAQDGARSLMLRETREVACGLLPDLARVSDEIEEDAWAQGRYPTAEEGLFGEAFDDAVRLTGDDFDPYVLTELRGLSTHEAGRLLGVDHKTVSRRADRARGSIREEIT